MSLKNYLLLSVFGFFLSCASIPNSTVTLTKGVISEGDNMHKLNIALVNQLFNERRERLNSFITNKYTPAIIERYQKLLPETLDYKKELPNIVKSIIPVINRKKDSLQNLLNQQRQKIITSLNTNFISYTKATSSLQDLINSAVKLKTTEDNVMSAINNLTGDKLDLKKVSSSIDNMLHKSGEGMGKLLKIEEKLNLK